MSDKNLHAFQNTGDARPLQDFDNRPPCAVQSIGPAAGDKIQSAPLLLTQKQVASILGLDRTSVWRLTNLGILKPIELSPGLNRFHRDDVYALARFGWRRVADRAAP